MDLKLKDVAELLNVSEATIRRWIEEDKIPHYRLSEQVRFSRNEIEHWVLRSKESFTEQRGTEGQERLGSQHFGLLRALLKGDFHKDVPGKNKEEVIREVMKRSAKRLRLDAEVIAELLLDREKLMPTALCHGIAVPHTRDFLLKESYDVVTLVFPEKPINFNALDGEPVHTLFFLFACDDKRHLHLLAKIAHFCNKPENRAFLLSRPNKDEFLQYIKTWEGSVRPPGAKPALAHV